jgi:8-oxo-dGTP pyrophosphatase MutT (NUDIX family)
MRTNHSVRAIAFDTNGRLVLIKRMRPGRETYWVTPGGGVETEDPDLHAALRRELWEELGAEVEIGEEMFVLEDRERTTHFFPVRILVMNPAARSGPEFQDPTRGAYEVVLVEPTTDVLGSINLVPESIRDLVVTCAS